MENSTTVRDGCTVQMHYTLTDASGRILDSSRTGDALSYVHGSGSIVPGLEAASNRSHCRRPTSSIGSTGGWLR